MEEILADLETPAERKLRRLSAQQTTEAAMPATPIGPADEETPGERDHDDDGASMAEIEYALLAGADVFTGPLLNEEIAKRYGGDVGTRRAWLSRG